MRLKKGLWRVVGRLADETVRLWAPASVTWLTSTAVLSPPPEPPPGPWFADGVVPAPRAARQDEHLVMWQRSWLPPHVPASSPLRMRPGVKLRTWHSATAHHHLLVVTGYNMGWAGYDASVLDLSWWRSQGYSVSMMGLPLHGTDVGMPLPPSWPSSDLDLTRDGLAAATQDIREAVALLRQWHGLPVVVLGVSLGAWPAALAATLPQPMDLLAALTPMVRYGALLKDHAPPWVLTGSIERVEKALAPMDPFLREPTVAPGRAVILAADGDLVTPDENQAAPLARHFRGELVHFQGTHLVPWGLRRAWRTLDEAILRTRTASVAA